MHKTKQLLVVHTGICMAHIHHHRFVFTLNYHGFGLKLLHFPVKLLKLSLNLYYLESKPL